MWLPVRAGSAGGVLLRDRAGRYLRANGKYLRWMVEPIGLRDGPPRIPPTIRARLPEGWHAFHFRGRSLNHLRNDLAGHVGQQPNGIVLCVRAGRYGRLTPLVVDLPRCGYGEILQIIIITTGTPGYNALRYQYVDQQPRGITTETPASTPIGNPGSDQRRDPDENINSKAEVLKQNTEQNINYRPEVALCQQSGQRELFPSGSAWPSLSEHPDVPIEAARANSVVAANRVRSIEKQATQAVARLEYLQQQNIAALPKEERKGTIKEMKQLKAKIRKLHEAAAQANEESTKEQEQLARAVLRHGV